MRAQRVRDAGSRAEMQMVTMGHRGRGESGMAASIPRRRRQALSGREYVGTLLSVRQFLPRTKVAPRLFTVLDESFLIEDVFLLRKARRQSP